MRLRQLRGVTALRIFEGVKVVVKPGPPCRVCSRSIPLLRDGRDGRWYQNLWLHRCGPKSVKMLRRRWVSVAA
jgi:hypothetical protein